jgi:hypothetical protein
LAKNRFVTIEELDTQKVKAVTNASDMVKAAEHRGKGGRPRKANKDKAEKFLNVYFTDDERLIVQAYCQKMHVSFSGFVKQILAEKGVI